MKIKFMVAATLMAALVTTTSCGNSNKQSQSEKTEQAAPAAFFIICRLPLNRQRQVILFHDGIIPLQTNPHHTITIR